MLTNFIGELLQHDSSHHQFSPYISEKQYLITTLDDPSRLLLLADLWEQETAFKHILALKTVVLNYGCPLKYYVDQHSIFRFVKGRDKNSPWRNLSKFTDDVDPQWKQALKGCGVGLTYALSAQVKGKVERPYRWIQDRLVRTAAREKITDIEGLRGVLKDLIKKYNTEWVHSTTKEVPIIRFEKALTDNRSLFNPLKIIQPDQNLNDIFCLRAQRIVDAYRKVSLTGLEIKVPGGLPRQTVDLHIRPDMETGISEVRFWQKDKYLGSQKVKTDDLKIVHF